MKNVFAFVCAPENSTPGAIHEYCRELYKMGYTPISPALQFAPFLNDNDPVQREDRKRMANALLRRCRVLVLCSDTVTEEMEISMMCAKRNHIVATTLAGVKKISAHIRTAG